MKYQMQVYTFLALATLAAVNAADHYLTEKPAFFIPCRIADPNFNACFLRNIQTGLREWRNGVPGIKSIGTLEPLQVKRISLNQDQSNPLAQINVDLHNAKIYGFTSLSIPEFDFDYNTLTAKFKVIAPIFRTTADYKIKGRVLNVDIEGSGKTDIKIDNIILNVVLDLKLRDEFGLTFIDINKLRLNIGDIGTFHIDNEFDNQKELQDTANALINQHWREFVPILTPTVSEAAEAVLGNKLSKLFAIIPSKYLVEDFPSAAEYYG